MWYTRLMNVVNFGKSLKEMNFTQYVMLTGLITFLYLAFIILDKVIGFAVFAMWVGIVVIAAKKYFKV